MTKRFLPLSTGVIMDKSQLPYLYGEDSYLPQFLLLLWKINAMYYLVKE